MNPSLRTQAASLTHPGLVRSDNEDSILQRDDIGLWVVADGMGGHDGGQLASSAVVEALAAIDMGPDSDGLLFEAERAIQRANTLIHQAAPEGRRMGTTVVGLLVDETTFTCFWAGDSRAYLLRGGQLYRLTQDHTVAQDLVDAGKMTPDEAAAHPTSHMLKRAVGVEPKVQLGTVRDVLLADDIFFLCSDGVHGVVNDAELSEVLLRRGPPVACQELLDMVLQRGAPDNASMIVVACQVATVLSFQAGG